MSMPDPSGWYLKHGDTTVVHHVGSSNGKLHKLAACGTKSESWHPGDSKDGYRTCLRCEAQLKRHGHGASVNFVQTGGEVTPLAYVPVPDLEFVIWFLETLEKAKPQHSILQEVIQLTINHLRKLIDEAKARCDRPWVATWGQNGS